MVAAVGVMGCLHGGSSGSCGMLTWWQQWERCDVNMVAAVGTVGC